MSGTAVFDELRGRLREIGDLEHAATLLSWDQEVCMPAQGVAARASSLETLRNLIHERWVSDEMTALLGRLDGSCELESLDGVILAEARRQHELAAKLPPALLGNRSSLSARARPVWRRAREERDWSVFAPWMRQVVELNLELAGALGFDEHPYDGLLQLSDRGMTAARLRRAFAEIERAARPLIEAATDAPQTPFLAGEWDRRCQLDFIRLVAAAAGVDESFSRLDVSAYPIANKIGPGDIRMTTHFGAPQLLRGIFGGLHELGHVVYASGLPASLEGTPLWSSPSFGVDESQSRLFENHLGRSHAFWTAWLPRLKLLFPGRLDGLEAGELYAAVNRIYPTPILLDADEVTYNLHVLVRFEIETDLLSGALDVDDVPGAWRDSMGRMLGVTVADDAEGPLQDIHWAGCYMGTFTSYTIGDLVAAQLMAAARRALPTLDQLLEEGSLDELTGWLRTNVHSLGARHSPDELVLLATGSELSTEAWIDHVVGKRGELDG